MKRSEDRGGRGYERLLKVGVGVGDVGWNGKRLFV